MPDEPNLDADRIKHALEAHGYPFHHAVLRTAERLYKTGFSLWKLGLVEFPVAGQGGDTRIDFVIPHQGGRWAIIGECKRANPAFDWCFVRAPYRHSRGGVHHLTVEVISPLPASPVAASAVGGGELLIRLQESFDVAFEAKNDTKGYDRGDQRGTIEKACTQLIRGVNGYVTALAEHIDRAALDGELNLLPVLFTTARLFVVTTDMGAATLESGRITDNFSVHEVPWLWYQFPMSPVLRHEYQNVPQERDAVWALDRFFTRSIAVVSSQGIGAFLTETSATENLGHA